MGKHKTTRGYILWDACAYDELIKYATCQGWNVKKITSSPKDPILSERFASKYHILFTNDYTVYSDNPNTVAFFGYIEQERAKQKRDLPGYGIKVGKFFSTKRAKDIYGSVYRIPQIGEPFIREKLHEEKSKGKK